MFEIDFTWSESYTKLLAFNQTQYERVLHLDADGWILAPMDELFLLPEAPVAMPRAYWLLHDDPPKRILSSQVMLVQPSEEEFARVKEKIDSAAEGEYDMEIVNQLYLDSAMVFPHRKYDLLTAEFRSDKHQFYLGSTTEKWDPRLVYGEAKFMHFSDWPVPKPWIPMDEDTRASMQPKCHKLGEEEDCTERNMWNEFYEDYFTTREVCIFLVLVLFSFPYHYDGYRAEITDFDCHRKFATDTSKKLQRKRKAKTPATKRNRLLTTLNETRRRLCSLFNLHFAGICSQFSFCPSSSM